MIPSKAINKYSGLSCEEVAEKLGIEVHRHKALCFMHDDHNPSLSFWGKERDRWNCFVCGRGGDAITLVREYHRYSFVEACAWLEQNFYGNYLEFSFPRKETECIKKTGKNDKVKQLFSSKIAQSIVENCELTKSGEHFLYNERKYDPSVVSKLRIVSVENSDKLILKLRALFDDEMLLSSGFCTQTNGKIYLRLFTPCLIFPYYNETMSIIGIQSRYIGTSQNVPRFQFISGQKTRVFNLPIIKELKYGEDLYISEGITDCIALLSANKKAVAIPSATILPFDDLYKLRYYKLHMYPDSDDAGDNAFAKLKKFYINHFATIIRETLPKGVKDYSDYYRMITQ